jgi:hypothetical protein
MPPLRNNSGRSTLLFVTRYFFHFHDGTDQPDYSGTELRNAQAARDAAVVFMGEKLKELDGGFWPDAEWSIRVVDEAGAAVCAIRVTGN